MAVCSTNQPSGAPAPASASGKNLEIMLAVERFEHGHREKEPS